MQPSTTRIGLPLDEFVRLYEAEGPFELYHGERKPLMSTVAGHSEVRRLLFRVMDRRVEAGQLGLLDSETTYVLLGTYTANWVQDSRVPDIMFIAQSRIEAYKSADPQWRKKPYIIVPDLVVEVISPNDSYTEIDEKVDVYLRDGVSVIWVLNPRTRKVIVHRQGSNQQTTLLESDVLDEPNLLPGFQITVGELFA